MKNNKTVEEQEKLSFTAYFKTVRNSHIELKNRIKEACDVSEATVDRWVYGLSVPNKLAQEKIAQITGKSITELFPEAEQCK